MHQDEQLHFRILTDSTSQDMRWVKNGAAELGFVFFRMTTGSLIMTCAVISCSLKHCEP